MFNNPSPLRYPGGKSKFFPIVCEILKLNNLLGSTYIEPFAGGAGLALRLLYTEKVRRIVINDNDPHIYAVWFSILEYGDKFCQLIEETPVTVKQWHIQKEIYKQCNQSNLLELGFATFFLNRCNVSGVLTAGIIGGKEQTGKNKIDARYNKQLLIDKIHHIGKYKEKILLYNEDAFDLFSKPEIKNLRNTFVNFDPPYVGKGAILYNNSFNTDDHKRLASQILHCRRKWIVTYDVSPLITEIYSRCRIGILNVTYSTGAQSNAHEYIIFPNCLRIPSNITLIEEGNNALN